MNDNKKILVTFRDAIGVCAIVIDNSGMSFLEGMVYFTDENGADYKISVSDLIGVELIQ